MMNEHKIAVIEDDAEIRELLVKELKKQNYLVFSEHDGAAGEKMILTESDLDLVILDLMLPHKDGIEIIKAVRKESTIPILILSAKDTEFDKVIGLENGADDYLSKPFSIFELLARVRSLVRRNNEYNSKKLLESVSLEQKEMDFKLLPAEYAISKNGTRIQLTNKEYKLLQLFVEQPRKVFTKYQIYQAVWDDEFLHDDNVVNVMIRRLRKKIEVNPSDPKYIVTVWGIGYKLGANDK